MNPGDPAKRGPGREVWLRGIVEGSIRQPRAVVLGWVLVAVVASVGVARLEIDTTTSSFLDREAPAWQFYQQSLDRYGGDEFLAIAFGGSGLSDAETLRRISDLTERFHDLPGVRRVDSLSTVPVINVDASGELELDPAIAGDSLESEEGLRRVAERVRKDRIAPRSLVSSDERTFAINLVLDEDVDGKRDVLVSKVEELLDGDDAWISGVPVFRTRVNTRTGVELARFVPLTLLLVGLVVFVGFRRLQAVAIALVTSGIGTALALGSMGAAGTPLSLSTITLPPILLAVGSAYVMHVLAAARGRAGVSELGEAIGVVAPAIALSGLTTAIGFLAMSTVRINAIRELGTYGAVGVVGVLAATLTLAPALLRIRPLDDRAAGMDGWLRGTLRKRLVLAVTRRPRAIALSWLVVLAAFSVGISRLHVETDIILWFPHGSDVRDGYEEIRERLSGITPMNVVIESTHGELVTEPEVLARIDALAAYLEARPEVGRALSVADPLRQLHEGFEGPQAGLPGSRALAEQYLLLLSSVEQIRDVISDDRLSANVVLRVDANGSRRLLSVSDQIDAWWQRYGAPGFSARTTGIMYEFGRAEEEIAWGQIRGLSLAFAAIAVVLLAIFRSPVAATAALLPNIVPLAITYGFMGLAGIPLDAATVCMGSVALGIAVDDTVHVATGFRDSLTEGFSIRESLERTLHRVLPALVLTTVAVGLGFLVLGVSEFTLIQHFGLVTSGMVALCLLADLTLLPVFLVWAQRYRSGS